MSEGLETILKRVSAGELTPEQALLLLDGAPPVERVGAPSAAVADEIDPELPITTVRLRTTYRTVELIADPEVAQIHVTGEHWVERTGDTLVVGTPGPLDDDDREERGAAGRFSFRNLPRSIAWARAWREHHLTLRFNPELRLDLDATGTDLKLTGPANVTAKLAASSMRGDKLRGQFDLSVMSSSVKLHGYPTGESRISAESSSVRLTLPGDVDLTISGNNRMGQLSLPDRPPSSFALEGERSEVTLGAGGNRLVVEAVMSSVSVNTNSWEEAQS